MFRWRFYSEGLLWEEIESRPGEWFPYSVCRTGRELLIARSPRLGRDYEEERYVIRLLSRRLLWLHRLRHGEGEENPRFGLILWRKESRQAEQEA